MAFYLYKECELEKLAGRFAADVYSSDAVSAGSSGAAALLAGHTVIVQTRGMAEYLQQFLAQHSGIAANLQTNFLKSYLNKLLGVLYGESFFAALRRSDVQIMQREIMRRLCDKDLVQEKMPALQRYINGRNGALKRWQLAGKIAGLFEQYQLYRAREPEKLFTAGEMQGNWQKVLYQELFNGSTPGCDAFYRKFLAEELSEAQIRKLPAMISIFGVGAMPPVYLDIFVRLSEYCQVNFFYLTVCMEYWEYQEPPQQISCPAAWDVAPGGNPLLQSLGRQGRGFFSALMDHDVISCQQEEPDFLCPDDYPDDYSMLQITQYDIQHLFDRRETAVDEKNPDNDFVGRVRHDLKDDNSITIHNCHSLRRELEVLHDELLKLIGQGIKPRDIIVMAPDIVRCAPVIKSVFGSGALKDVYSIADVPPEDKLMAQEVFHRVLTLASGRFEYSEIMAFLDLPMIADLLEIPGDLMPRIAELLYDAGARWGFDGAMHRKFCANDFREFSWQYAMDRLLSGWANRSCGEDFILSGNVSSMEALEGNEIEPFARVVKLLENLAALAREISEHLSVNAWCGVFERILNDFFRSDNSSATALTSLRMAVNEMKNIAREMCAPGLYPLNAAWEMLQDNLADNSESSKFLRGRITFCRMTPMRSIPHKVVAVIDLNENTFPRRNNTLGFDLIARMPMPGDWNHAIQDRYLLLEAILSARNNLLLFYQGQNARDNQPMAPCAPLSEIAGYLSNAFGLEEFKHKVSGIDEVYYAAGSRCRSLAQDNYEALKSRSASLQKISLPHALPGVIMPLLPAENISLDTLVEFFGNHCCYVMRKQLELYYRRGDEEENSDDEMWLLDHIGQWQINNLLADMRQRNCSDDQIFEYARSSNMLPPGCIGEKSFAQCAGKLPELPDEWKNLIATIEKRPVSCRISGNIGLSGMVNMTPDGSCVIGYRWSSYDSSCALKVLFGTLIAAAGADDMFSMVGGRLINLESGKYVVRNIAPVSPLEAREKLQKLLDIAFQTHLRVLPLFKKSSVYYSDPAAAKKKFYDPYHDYGDAADPNVQAFFSKEDWADPVFQEDFLHYGKLLYGDISAGEVIG